MRPLREVFLAGIFVVGSAFAAPQEPPAQPVTLRIDEPALHKALIQFTRQAGLQLIFREPQRAADLKAPRLTGSYTPREALDKLLQGSGFTYEFMGPKAVAIYGPQERPTQNVTQDMRGEAAATAQLQLAQAETASSRAEREQAPDEASGDKGVPEILVKGNRALNADIKRTRDDVQPYVVFEREDIARSQALNLGDFLRKRLPMDTTLETDSQNVGSNSPGSSINLRGLGPEQTLILVDGRRLPAVSRAGEFGQPDINGIPMASIERIEVLPSTAGGIYGGGATGGVINIILRKDYKGLELQAAYASPFDADAASRRIDASAGFTLGDGTQFLFSASRTDSDPLLVGHRDFAARGRALLFANNPSEILEYNVVGATVNIRGAGNLTLDPQYGGSALNSRFTHIPLGYAGPASDGGAALLANAGRHSLELPNDLRGAKESLLAGPTMQSISASLRRPFGERVEAFLDLAKLDNRSIARTAGLPNVIGGIAGSAPNNPFQQNIIVSFAIPGIKAVARGQSDTLRSTAGLIVRVASDWMVSGEYGLSRSRSSRTGTSPLIDNEGYEALRTGLPSPDGRPALNVLQEQNTYPLDLSPYLLPAPNSFAGPFDTVLETVSLRFSGSLLRLPAGPVVLAGLLERRDQDMKDALDEGMGGDRVVFYRYYPKRLQDAQAYYLEARAPVFSATNALPFVRELEVQASVRGDRYRTVSNSQDAIVSVPSREGPFPDSEYTTNRTASRSYTLGLRYSPVQDMVLRASYGTGVLPVSLTEIAPSILDFGPYLPGPYYVDPKRGGVDGPGVGGELDGGGVPFPLVLQYGGSPSLRPEQSESLSMGLVLTPHFLPGLRFSADYTRIRKTDEVGGVMEQYVIDHEDLFPGRITRRPLTAADSAAGYTGGVITAIDASLFNIAATDVEAFDFQLDHEVQMAARGSLRFHAIATWQPHYRMRVLPQTPVEDTVGYTYGPLELRGNFGVDWQQGAWNAGWSAQYYDTYRVESVYASDASNARTVFNQGASSIPSQIYYDAVVGYRFDDSVRLARGLFSGLEVQFGMQNLLNTSPPILATTGAVGGYSTYGDPRLRRYSLTVRKQFGAR